VEIEFEKDIGGDPRIQPGSLVSLSSMSKDVFCGRVGGNLNCPSCSYNSFEKNGA